MRCLMIALVFILSGCGSSQALTGGGSKVQLLETKAGSQCSSLGKVVGENNEDSVELARNDARNKAAQMDANSLRINQEVGNGKSWKVHATAYFCKDL